MLFARRFVSVIAFATVFFTSLSAQAPPPSPGQPTPQQQQKAQPKCADNGTYVNSKGADSQASGELLGSAPRCDRTMP